MIRVTIPDGVRGTRATLSAMARMAERGSKCQAVRETATAVTLSVPARDARAEAAALHSWVRLHVRFVKDPLTAELVQTPRYTLAHRVGDCDDQATLLAALLLSIGIPARFQAAGSHPDAMQHVWAEAWINGEWTPLDTAAPQALAAGQYAIQTEALPVRMFMGIAGCGGTPSRAMGDLPGLPAEFQSYAQPRGSNPYPGWNTGKQSTVFDFSGVTLTPANIAHFLAPGKAQPLLVAAMAERMTDFQDFLNAFTSQVAPWAAMIMFEPGYSGPATSPPIPVNDIYIPNLASCGFSTGGGATGGNDTGHYSPFGTQLKGLGDAVTNPCNPNQKGNAIMLPGGGAILEGNTNGYYIDWLGWFVWALQNNKVQVTPAWFNSSKHSDWFNENIADPHGLLNKIAPPLITALVAAGITMGIASGVSSFVAANTASGVGSAATGGAGAGAGSSTTIGAGTIGGGTTAGGLPAASITLPGVTVDTVAPISISPVVSGFTPSIIANLPPVNGGLTPGGLPATNITPPAPTISAPAPITGPGATTSFPALPTPNTLPAFTSGSGTLPPIGSATGAAGSAGALDQVMKAGNDVLQGATGLDQLSQMLNPPTLTASTTPTTPTVAPPASSGSGASVSKAGILALLAAGGVALWAAFSGTQS